MDAGAERLGEGFLGGEALGEVVRRQAMAMEAPELGLAQDPAREALAEALERAADALDLHHVGTDPVDHREDCTIRAFISRTASPMPTTTARKTRAWPLCGPPPPANRATGSTLK